MAIDQTDIAGRLDNALHWLDQNDIADLDVAQISAAAGRLTRKLAVYPTIFTNAARELPQARRPVARRTGWAAGSIGRAGAEAVAGQSVGLSRISSPGSRA